MVKNSVHVKIPFELQQRAKENGINISGVCRKAVCEILAKVEQPNSTRVESGKTVPGSTSVGGQ